MDRMLTDEEIIAIGKRLKDLRENLGLTQQEFANKLFWDVSSYQKIESGKILMTLDKAAQLHRDYNVDLNYFAVGDTFDKEDVIARMLINSSKQDSANMIIRLLEYFIQLIKMGLKNENETDSDT